MTRFQLIFTALLIAIGVAAVIVFATSKGGKSDNAPLVTMWGTMKKDTVAGFLSNIAISNKATLNVNYIEKSPITFEAELVAALARDNGPDMVLLPQNLLIRQMDKFYAIPYTSYSERLFRDSFIQEGELFLAPPVGEFKGGIIGLPFSVDPMVMYWNRDMFSNEGIALPPKSWTDFYTLIPKFTKKDANGNILQSLVAFGEMRNVTHAKDMIALLAIQAGNPIIGRDRDGSFESKFDLRNGSGFSPSEEAVNYYTGFSDPVKVSYTWNRSLPNDKVAFTGGKLALYFGYASEINSIRAANPNLNFDVAEVPQAVGKRATYGNMHSIVILRSSPNINAAYLAATTLTSAPIQQMWNESSGLPPVRRDLLTKLPGDAYKAVFYQSALISTAWLDPYREVTSGIFTRLIENVTSGKMRISESVRAASLELDNSLRATI